MRPRGWMLLMAFAAFGLLWGGWQAVLPELSREYGLSTGPLGAMLTFGFAVSLPAMLGLGRLLDRAGARWGLGLPGAAMAAGLALASSLPELPLLVVAVTLMAAGSGAFDVAINGVAMGHRTWSRPARLTLLHAAFSAGGLSGAVLAGAAIGTDVPFRWVYLAIAVAMAITTAILVAARWPVAAPMGRVTGGLAAAMLPLAVLTALAFLVEGSMETWSALYLRTELDAVAFVSALGPAAFHGAMLAGRLVGAGVAGALGASRTLLVGGTMSVAGMGVALLVPVAGVAIPGLAVAALGVSFVVPVVVSLAAARAGAHAGRAASYVLTLGYGGFLVGPSLIGLLGEAVGLRLALTIIPVAAAVIALSSRSSSVRE